MTVIYVLWDTYDDDYVRGVYRDLATAVETAVHFSNAEEAFSTKVDIEASDITETKCSDNSPLYDNPQFHDANQLTGEINHLLGNRSLDFKVMLPVDNHMLARITHCDRSGLGDKIIFTPIQLPMTDEELLNPVTLWALVTLADDGPYGSVTTIECSHDLSIMYEKFDNYMSVEHNRDDGDHSSSDSKTCQCGLSDEVCLATSCRLCDDNKMDECSRNHFLELLRNGNVSLEHCSSEVSVVLLKFKLAQNL